MTSLSERDTAASSQVVAVSDFRRFMRGWATGVAVVTSALGGHPTGCTVNTFISVSLAPPLLLVSLADDSNTLAAIRTRGMFAVNVLTGQQERLAARFALSTADRFHDVPYHLIDGVPVIADVAGAAVCALTGTMPAADHVLVFGRPRSCERTGSAGPLLFLDGGYRRA